MKRTTHRLNQLNVGSLEKMGVIIKSVSKLAKIERRDELIKLEMKEMCYNRFQGNVENN